MKLDKIFELKLPTQIVCFRIVYATSFFVYQITRLQWKSRASLPSGIKLAWLFQLLTSQYNAIFGKIKLCLLINDFKIAFC